MDAMHAYPLADTYPHNLEGLCGCDFTMTEVIWDDEPNTTYLLITHQTVNGNSHD